MSHRRLTGGAAPRSSLNLSHPPPLPGQTKRRCGRCGSLIRYSVHRRISIYLQSPPAPPAYLKSFSSFIGTAIFVGPRRLTRILELLFLHTFACSRAAALSAFRIMQPQMLLPALTAVLVSMASFAQATPVPCPEVRIPNHTLQKQRHRLTPVMQATIDLILNGKLSPDVCCNYGICKGDILTRLR